MKNWIKTLWEYGVMTLGAVLYAIGIALFLDPNKLAPGGVSGISIILSHFVPIETGTLIFIINIPLVILGYMKLGRKLMWRTFYCLITTSVMIDGISSFFSGQAATNDLLLSSLAGAILVGAGIGLIMKEESTTGGTDIIVRLLRKRFPHIKTGSIFSAMDCVIVAISAIVFRDLVIAMYALIATFATAYVIDRVLYGEDEAKMLYIISDHSQPIAERMMKEMEIGVTYIQGKGAYSGKDKEVILVVMRKTLAPKAEEIVKEVDPAAFMIVTSANEIYGEGYKNIFSEKL